MKIDIIEKIWVSKVNGNFSVQAQFSRMGGTNQIGYFTTEDEAIDYAVKIGAVLDITICNFDPVWQEERITE